MNRLSIAALLALTAFGLGCREAPTTIRVFLTYTVEADMVRVGGGASRETDFAWTPGDEPIRELVVELPSNAEDFDLWVHAFADGTHIGTGGGRARPSPGQERTLDIEIVPSSCPPSCSLGAVACQDTATTTLCATGADGCPEWQRGARCGAGTYCANGGCEAACDECTEGAAECQNDGIVRTCVEEENCLRWVEAECRSGRRCAGGVCEAPACEFAECTLGSAECVVGGLRRCVDRDGDGCGEWGTTLSCSCSAGSCCEPIPGVEEWEGSALGTLAEAQVSDTDGVFILRRTDEGLVHESLPPAGRQTSIPVDELADFALADASSEGFAYFYSTSDGRLRFRRGVDERTTSMVSSTVQTGTGLRAVVSGGSIHVFYLDTPEALLTWAHRPLESSGDWIREDISGTREWLRVVAIAGAPSGPPSVAAVAQAGSNFELVVYRRQDERPTAAWQNTSSSDTFSAALALDEAGDTHVAFATSDVPGFGYAAVPSEAPAGGLHTGAETESVGVAGATGIDLTRVSATWAVTRAVGGFAEIFLRAEGWERVETGIESEAVTAAPRLLMDEDGNTYLISASDGMLHYAANRCAF